MLLLNSTSNICRSLGDGVLQRLLMPINTTTTLEEMRRMNPEAFRSCLSLSALPCQHSYASVSYHCGAASSPNGDWSHCAGLHEALMISQIEAQPGLRKAEEVQRVVGMLAEIGVAIALTGPPGVGKSTIGGLATHYGFRMLDLEDVGGPKERPPTVDKSHSRNAALADAIAAQLEQARNASMKEPARRPPMLVGLGATGRHGLRAYPDTSMERLISIVLWPSRQTIFSRWAARNSIVHDESQAAKVRSQLDESRKYPVLSQADAIVASEGCAEQVLMDVCTAAILWLAEAATEAARLCLQDGYLALHWRGGKPHSPAALQLALSRCAKARRATRFLRMSDEYEIDVGRLLRSAALLERPSLRRQPPTRFVAIAWGCARALWASMRDYVRAAVAPGEVSAGCVLRFASGESLERFVRGVYSVDQVKPSGLATKLRHLAPCAREALVLNVSVPYPLFRVKGSLKGAPLHVQPDDEGHWIPRMPRPHAPSPRVTRPGAA